MHFQSDDSDAFELLLNQQERFLIVQSAGNGYDNGGVDLMLKDRRLLRN